MVATQGRVAVDVAAASNERKKASGCESLHLLVAFYSCVGIPNGLGN